MTEPKPHRGWIETKKLGKDLYEAKAELYVTHLGIQGTEQTAIPGLPMYVSLHAEAEAEAYFNMLVNLGEKRLPITVTANGKGGYLYIFKSPKSETKK